MVASNIDQNAIQVETEAQPFGFAMLAVHGWISDLVRISVSRKRIQHPEASLPLMLRGLSDLRVTGARMLCNLNTQLPYAVRLLGRDNLL